MVLAGCLPEPDCGTQSSDYCVNGSPGFLISGGTSPCECPSANDVTEIANQRCLEDGLVCAIGGRYGTRCSCQDGLWSCQGYERDLSVPRDLSLPDLRVEDLRGID